MWILELGSQRSLGAGGSKRSRGEGLRIPTLAFPAQAGDPQIFTSESLAS